MMRKICYMFRTAQLLDITRNPSKREIFIFCEKFGVTDNQFVFHKVRYGRKYSF